MARIFLDANSYIDVSKRSKEKLEPLRNNFLFISPLSIHILFYTQKLKVPDGELNKMEELFGIVPLTKYIIDKAVQGPTSDLEDNIQLHSSSEAECDIFLTNDAKLLKMKFFGKTEILSNI